MSIKVAKVLDDYTLVLNAGSESGIEVGQRFLIYNIGDEVVDPDSGEPLGTLELIKGTGKATHVQERMCTVASDMTASANRTIRRTTTSPASALSAFMGRQQVEEVLPAEKVPFEDASVGDLAKRI